jgi:hypothetical protein
MIRPALHGARGALGDDVPPAINGSGNQLPATTLDGHAVIKEPELVAGRLVAAPELGWDPKVVSEAQRPALSADVQGPPTAEDPLTTVNGGL